MTSVNLQQMFKDHQENDEITCVPEAEYTLEVQSASVRGDNALIPVLKVLEGPYAGKRVMVGQLTLTEKARGIFFRNLRGFGIGEDFFATGAGLKEVAVAMKGRIVKMRLTVRVWEGEDRNSFPIGGVKLVQADGAVPAGVPQPAAPPAAQPAPAVAAVPDPPAQSSNTTAVPPPPPAGTADPSF